MVQAPARTRLTASKEPIKPLQNKFINSDDKTQLQGGGGICLKSAAWHRGGIQAFKQKENVRTEGA